MSKCTDSTEAPETPEIQLFQLGADLAPARFSPPFTLGTTIHNEIDRIEQALTGRVKELADRYATPLPAMTGRVAELESKATAHLAKMGFY